MPDMMRGAALLVGAGIAAATALPPLATWGQELFAFHMTQHLLLIALAAPLVVLGGLELRLRPVYAWTLFVGVFLFWHWPAAFRWVAIHNLTLLELASVFLAAIAFWSSVLGEGRLSDGGRALMVMTAAVTTDLPGVVMLFAPVAFCSMPGERAGAFGLSPLQDQEFAGILMWVPANLVFFGVATFLFARWIKDPEVPSPSSLVTS
jgi:putative membrane protein